MYLLAHKIDLKVNHLNYEVWCFGNISTGKGDLLPKICFIKKVIFPLELKQMVSFISFTLQKSNSKHWCNDLFTVHVIS